MRALIGLGSLVAGLAFAWYVFPSEVALAGYALSAVGIVTLWEWYRSEA